MKTTYLKRGTCGLVAAFSLFAHQAFSAPVAIATDPLFLTVNVAPNLIVTLDDSGSMARAFTPDVCGNPNAICDSNPDSGLDPRYLKSSHYNPIYYNPAFVYAPPVDANGNALTTSFTAAHINGFATSLSLNSATQYNLSTRYRPSAGLFLHTTTKSHEFMRHYASDVRCNQVSGTDPCQFNSTSGTGVDTWVNMENPVVDCNDNTQCQSRPMPAYYYKFDGSNTNCTGTDEQKRTDNDCYDLVIVSATSGPGTVDYNGDGVNDTDERQNFANWYSFYRTRNLATISATAIAFASVHPSTRVAWQALNSCRGGTGTVVTADCEGWETTAVNFSNAIKTFSGQHRQNFYNWLFRLRTNTSTPLREAMNRAGAYFKTSGENSPYDNDFTTANSGELSCRRNFHILMTDGIYTDTFDLDDVQASVADNYDNADKTLPDGVNYVAAAPYEDANSNSLADIAFYYWSNDLRNLDDNLVPRYPDKTGLAAEQYVNPANDPADWQHMVNYTVGLGLEAFLTQAGLTWGGSTYAGSYTSIKNGVTQWPSTASDGGKVADLWHAAINSRGRFYSASNPAALNTAFSAIVNDISTSSGSSAALSANSTSIKVGSTLVYQAKFDSNDWSGTLLALPVQGDGSIGSAIWDAATKVPAHGERNIFTYVPDSDGLPGGSGRGFTSCAGADYAPLKSALDFNAAGIDDGKCATRLAWLRGDNSLEVKIVNGVTVGEFRARNGKTMGDIINSDPAYVYTEDLGYGALSGAEGSSYADFVTDKANRPPMVYVGSNDGMLHAIQAAVAGDDKGKEVFAFVPSGVYGNLSKLTDPGYSHVYYVDGAPTAGDAYWDGSWHTVVVGGLNAGGKTIYALDVSDPTNFSAANVLWEYADIDLGLTYSQPQIARLNNGVWAAIFGNGYNSPNEQAYLYVLNLETGELIKKIAAGNANTSNGLSTPVLLDTNNDKVTDVVYAGDLRGNLWKFDLSNNDSDQWGVAYGGAPVFSARDSVGGVQAITSKPVVTGHTNGGYMVLFGTGLYLNQNDVVDASVQSFYGIWDNGIAAIATLDRSELQSQTIDFQGAAQGFDVRVTSQNNVDWLTKRGWYLDLLEPSPALPKGERVVSTPIIKGDRVIFVTLIPKTDPCAPGGESWLMEVSILTGGALAEPVFDLNADNEFDTDDLVNDGVVAGIKSTVGISKTPVWLDTSDSNIAFKELSGTSGGIATIKNKGVEPPGGGGGGGTATRIYWIEIR